MTLGSTVLFRHRLSPALHDAKTEPSLDNQEPAAAGTWVPALLSKSAFVLIPLAILAYAALGLVKESRFGLDGLLGFGRIAIPVLILANCSPLVMWIARPLLITALCLIGAAFILYVVAETTHYWH
jgi:hypothetical protein